MSFWWTKERTTRKEREKKKKKKVTPRFVKKARYCILISNSYSSYSTVPHSSEGGDKDML